MRLINCVRLLRIAALPSRSITHSIHQVQGNCVDSHATKRLNNQR
ncbi:hypothetical protein [Nostoc sp.]